MSTQATQLTLPSAMTSLLTEVPKLDDHNWVDFKGSMEMFFMGAGALYLVDPTDSTVIPADCQLLDKQLVVWIWSRMESEFHYLVQADDVRRSALKAWRALMSHFTRSTFPRRIAARTSLYSIEHDPSKSIDVFINDITAAVKVLRGLGCAIEDQEIKDVLLMRLDTSFSTIRTTIMTAKTEPDLAEVKSLLSSSTSSISIKSEPVAGAMVASTGRRNLPRISSSSSTVSTTLPDLDAKGYQWCDTSRDCCHRCGRPNHIAVYCIFDMPRNVKDWVMKGGHRERAQVVVAADDEFDYTESAGFAVVDAGRDHGPLHI